MRADYFFLKSPCLSARFGSVRFGPARYGSVRGRYGSVRLGTRAVRFGTARYAGGGRPAASPQTFFVLMRLVPELLNYRRLAYRYPICARITLLYTNPCLKTNPADRLNPKLYFYPPPALSIFPIY